jgi:glutamate dehydrogenase (NADP+)
LVKNGCIAIAEGANMPTELSGIEIFRKAGVLFAPSKAANAGGVACSGLEMTQNSMRLSWSREELDRRLRGIMAGVHERCVEYGEGNGKVDYIKGANISGFVKLADAITAYGIM